MPFLSSSMCQPPTLVTLPTVRSLLRTRSYYCDTARPVFFYKPFTLVAFFLPRLQFFSSLLELVTSALLVLLAFSRRSSYLRGPAPFREGLLGRIFSPFFKFSFPSWIIFSDFSPPLVRLVELTLSLLFLFLPLCRLRASSLLDFRERFDRRSFAIRFFFRRFFLTG